MLVRIIRENIEFHLDLADQPLIVQADTGMIEQVVMNMVTNARDAMLEGGRLSIATDLTEMDDHVAVNGYGKPGGRYALITVSDTGQGMDEATLKRIFEPFFTTKEVGDGTGLGLSISYGIVKQHNGFIKVSSKPGEGTVFKIYLPLYAGVSQNQKLEGAVPIKGGNETVLVAEDDKSLRELNRRVLESFGYHVITAVDGEEAILTYMENSEGIDLLMLDMIMPKKNGKEVAEAVRKVSPGIKVLFASGYSMDAISAEEMAESSFDFIRKPFQSKNLLLKVREVLDK
jgi:CheY-like chemotaxis protein